MTREELEQIVLDMHKAHYSPENPNGLWKPDESPNANTIYKIWSDGEITYEKGGFAYGERSLKQSRGPLVYLDKSTLPKFPNDQGNGNSYAILTTDECYKVLALLRQYFDPYMPKRVEVRVEIETDVLERLVREIAMDGLKIVYRSPVNDMFVVQSMMGSAEDVQLKLDARLRMSCTSYTLTLVD